MSQSSDTSQELIILPYKSGMKLIRPRKRNESDSKITAMPYKTIGDAMAIPCNVYFLDHESRLVAGNEPTAQTMHFDSVSKAIGKSLSDTWDPESAKRAHDNDLIIKKSKQGAFFEELEPLEHEAPNNLLSIKLPWYDSDDRVLGVFGFAVVLGRQPLSQSLADINSFGFLLSLQPQTFTLSHINILEQEQQIYLGARELEIFRLLIVGKRCPEIAAMTGLSPRTVEHYIVNIKSKFGVDYKHELIEKAFHIMNAYHLLP